MKLAIFGTGYVGLVTGACLANGGHEVVCVDVDAAKVALLQDGRVPIFEPGLPELVARNVAEGRLRFTTQAPAAVAHGQVLFIAVGTPPGEDGSADLAHVQDVARTIATHMDGWRLVVTKSTVPVGTADRVAAEIATALRARGADLPFDVVANPEFLKEGAAVDDFLKPDRIIVGAGSERARERMREVYEPFHRNRERMQFMDARSAELTKYASNAMLATKISFMNELANIAERVGADIEEVRQGMGADPRIGWDCIDPGCGYGGSCFPKDVRALERTASQAGYDAQLLRAVDAVNVRQKRIMLQRLEQHFAASGGLAGRRIAVWGLAFKPNTGDMREAPSRVLMEGLWEAGARVQAFDPAAMPEAARLYPRHPGLVLARDAYAAADGADALAICTEWQPFRSPDFEQLARRLKQRVIVDGRNLYRPARLREAGWTYYAVGRPAPGAH